MNNSSKIVNLINKAKSRLMMLIIGWVRHQFFCWNKYRIWCTKLGHGQVNTLCTLRENNRSYSTLPGRAEDAQCKGHRKPCGSSNTSDYTRWKRFDSLHRHTQSARWDNFTNVLLCQSMDKNVLKRHHITFILWAFLLFIILHGTMYIIIITITNTTIIIIS